MYQSKIGNPIKSCTVGGYILDVDVREGIQEAIYLNSFEQEETRWVRDILKPGMTFVDVGASVGYHSFIASSLVGGTGKVYAFEPSEYAYNLFIHNIRKNNIHNIIPSSLALGDKEETRQLYDSVGLPENVHNIHAPSFLNRGEMENGRRYAGAPIGLKQVTTLDTLSGQMRIGYIDLIKIDVEGFELPVLKGMDRLFHDRKVNAVIIEYLENGKMILSKNSDTKEMDDMLQSFGFEITKTRIYGNLTDKISFGNFLYTLTGGIR
jgi:FkbM family methyltransferase